MCIKGPRVRTTLLRAALRIAAQPHPNSYRTRWLRQRHLMTEQRAALVAQLAWGTVR